MDRWKEKGMSLIEVAMALLILSLGVPGSLALFRLSDHRLWEAQRMTESTASAQAKIEALLAAPVGNLATELGEEMIGGQKRRWAVRRLTPGLWQFEVEVVSPEDRTGRAAVRLSTLREAEEPR